VACGIAGRSGSKDWAAWPEPWRNLLERPWLKEPGLSVHDGPGSDAIYTYLSAIPHAEPGNCTGAGQ
jgi:hypothetical protein